jgi:beta-lactam-binding protein with PASTA domain
MARDQQTSPDGAALEDESTHAQADWPVAPQYQVVPEVDLGHHLDEERGAVTIAPAPRRWGFAAAVALATVAALLVLVGAATAWLATRPDQRAAATPPAQPRAGHGARTPNNGGSRSGAATSKSTDTTEATETTTASSTDAVRTAVVPGVVGLTASDAAQRLRHAQLVPTIRLVSSSRASGTVLAQKPDAEAKLDAGSRVELRVAKEPRPVRVALPKLMGSTAETAKERLRSLALHWSVTSIDSSRPRNTVLVQSPSAGTRVAKGSTVRLTVSAGPTQVAVPDVTGLDEASARAQLLNAGFDVTVVDRVTSEPSEDGMVVDQTPTGGSSAPKGSAISITVARSS